MASTSVDSQSLEHDLTLAQAAVTKQGDEVRALKASVKEGKAEKVAAERSGSLDFFTRRRASAERVNCRPKLMPQ